MDGGPGTNDAERPRPETDAARADQDWRERLYQLNPWARGLDVESDPFAAARQNACVIRWIQGFEVWNVWAAAMRTLRLDKSKVPDLYEAVAVSDFSELCFRNGANFERFKFPGPADFRGVQFGEVHRSPGRVSFHRAKFRGGHTSFARAKFSGGNADFTQATFSGGDAWFARVTFNGGEASFRQAKFSGGRAWFVETTFSGGEACFAKAKFSGGEASFSQAKFSGGRALFAAATFSGGAAIFSRATFSGGDARFDGATFSGGHASFNKVAFSGGEASFARAAFSGGFASFSQATFSGGDARFGKATFSGGDALFHKATFSGNARFGGVTFSGGDVRFAAATFKRTVYLTDVRFISTERTIIAEFDRTNFYGSVMFDGAEFAIANFRSIKSEGSFSLRAMFWSTPDFREASFHEPPQLDDVEIKPSLTRRFVGGDRRRGPLDWAKHAPDKREHGRFRALRGLAEQGNDHVNALRFNADEIAARRFWIDEPFGKNSGRFWLGWLYQLTSGYGRSILRPLIGLTAVVVGFAGIFFTSAQPGNPMSTWDTACHPTFAGDLALQPTTKPTEAINLSIRNALIFDRTDTSRRTYGCLFGLVDNGRAGAVPPAVSKLSLLESLLSAIFLFLIGLAVRNMFRLG